MFSYQAEGKIVVPWCLKAEGKRKRVIGSHVIPIKLLLTFIHLMPIFFSLNLIETHWCFPQYGSYTPQDEIFYCRMKFFFYFFPFWIGIFLVCVWGGGIRDAERRK